MAGRLPCKCLCFVGQVLFQRIRRISLEHGADLRIGAVFPQRVAWHVKGNAAGLDDALYLQLAQRVKSARCLNNGERVKFDTLRGKGIVLNLEHVPEDTDRIIELTLR